MCFSGSPVGIKSFLQFDGMLYSQRQPVDAIIDTPLQVPTLEKGTEHCLKISVCMLLELIFFKLNVAMHVIKISFLNSLILGNETMEFSK